MQPDRSAELRQLLAQRLLILDGAMGTMVQRHGLTEADYRGARFADHAHDLKGNNDLLVLTRPDVIGGIHAEYLEAGADILETCTFNSTARVAGRLQAGRAGLRTELRRREAGARPVRRGHREESGQAALRRRRARPDLAHLLALAGRERPRLPQRHLRRNWSPTTPRRSRGLVDGGADILLVETIFDTLNAKAALFAIEKFFDEAGRRWPVMISGTITDASGRTLSGQTAEAFWNSLRHVRPLSFGLNCALGAKELRQYVEELSRVCDCFVSAHPNAGLPNAFGGYDETPEMLADEIGDWAKIGIVNIVGGCCGTSPDHIRAIAEGGGGRRAAAVPPRLTLRCASPDSSPATSAPTRCS